MSSATTTAEAPVKNFKPRIRTRRPQRRLVSQGKVLSKDRFHRRP